MAWAAPDDNPFTDPSVAAARASADPSGSAPSWLRGGQPAAQPPPPPPPPPGQAPPAIPTGGSTRAPAAPAVAGPPQQIPQVFLYIRVINIGLCVLLSATAVIELIGIPGFGDAILACYLLAFACILCCFETHLKMISQIIAGNFGFLYNAYGRCTFMLFVGILCFSFSLLGYISGICMICASLLNFYAVFKYPEIEGQRQKSDMGADLQNQAVRGAANYASNNPEQAAKAARSAAGFV